MKEPPEFLQLDVSYIDTRTAELRQPGEIRGEN